MPHNPNNRARVFNGSTESKRSKAYRKMYPVKPLPRRKPCKHFSRPLMFDIKLETHRLFLKAFNISYNMLTIGNAWDKECTEYFLYEKDMTIEIITNYQELL